MNGPWLSLLPVTDPKPFKSSSSTSTINNSCNHSNQIKFKSNKRPALHTHNHHPTSNSILKPIILETKPKSKKPVHTHILSTSNSTPINSCFDSSFKLKSSSLLINRSTQDHDPFEIRNLKVADLEKVKELHHSTLPITYPTSFFCNLLMKQENDVALVATLPSSLPAGYFDLKVQESNSSLTRPDSHHHLSNHHHHHHLLHHVTSPLSGKKPISLDIIGSITSTFKPDTNETRILTLCVDHQYRRHGLGSMLIKELIMKSQGSESHRLSLHVQATNSIALKFYLRLGFKKLIFKESYYSNQALKPLNHLRSTTASSTTSTCTSSTSSPASASASTSASTSDDGLDDESNSSMMVKDIDAWFLVLDLSTS